MDNKICTKDGCKIMGLSDKYSEEELRCMTYESVLNSLILELKYRVEDSDFENYAKEARDIVLAKVNCDDYLEKLNR